MNTVAEPPRGTRAWARWRRCDRKIAYSSEWVAINAATALRWTGRPHLRPYACPHCQHWHLTSMEAR